MDQKQQIERLRDEALKYAEHGFKVFQVIGKKPLKFGWQELATADPSRIEEWWKDFPYSIGLKTGLDTGFWVLDLDSEEAVEALGVELPATPIQHTSRGFHYLFKCNGLRIKSTTGVLAPNVDTRGEGGLICAAPSPHRDTGRAYVWDVDASYDDIEIADTPPELLALLQEKGLIITDEKPRTNGARQPEPETDSNYGLVALAEECVAVATAPIGGQEDTLNKSSFRIGQLVGAGHLRFDTCAERLIAAGLEMENDPSKAPWKETEIHKKVWRALEDGAERPRESAAEGPARPQTESVTPEASGYWGPELRHYEPGPIEYLIEPIIVPGFTILAGAPKVGKSFLVLDACVNVPRGRSVASSFPCEQTGVVCIALEDTKARIKRRLIRLGVEGEEIPARVRFEHEWPTGKEGAAKLDEFLSENPDIRIVFIDTLQKFLSPDVEESYRRTSEELRPLFDLTRKHGCAIIAIMHTRKASVIPDSDRDNLDFDNVIGSRAYTAVADTIIMLVRKKDEKTGRLGYVGRDIGEGVYNASFKEGRWTFATSQPRQTTRKRVLELFEQQSELVFTPKEVCERLDLKKDADHDAMRQMLRRLETAGVIRKDAHGRYGTQKVNSDISKRPNTPKGAENCESDTSIVT